MDSNRSFGPSPSPRVGLLHFNADLRLGWVAGAAHALFDIEPEHVGSTAREIGGLAGYPEFEQDVARARAGARVARTVRGGQVHVTLQTEGGAPGACVVALLTPAASPTDALAEATAPLQPSHLARAVVLATRHERTRMTRLIHEDLQQLLHATLFRLDHLLELGGSLEETGPIIRELLRETISLTHAIPTLLTPPMSEGLALALGQLARTMEDRFGLQVELSVRGATRDLSQEANELLHEAARELLFNVYKHAGVRQARVDLSFEPDAVQLVVRDDGQGFEVGPPAAEPQGLGLRHIRSRLALVGGQLTVSSERGSGTRSVVRIPTGR